MTVSTPAERPARQCGHSVHVGTCPACQRFQLERWRSQLLQVYARGELQNPDGRTRRGIEA